jgi:hypothetical protein
MRYKSGLYIGPLASSPREGRDSSRYTIWSSS